MYAHRFDSRADKKLRFTFIPHCTCMCHLVVSAHLHSLVLLPHHLSDHPAVPTAIHLQLPRCGGQIPCALPLRTLAPWPRTSPSHVKNSMIERGDPWCRFFTQPQTCRLSRFLQFVAIRSFTADRSLLQPTDSVTTTLHTSHFLTESHAHAWLKSCVWRAHTMCHPHVFVLTLFD